MKHHIAALAVIASLVLTACSEAPKVAAIAAAAAAEKAKPNPPAWVTNCRTDFATLHRASEHGKAAQVYCTCVSQWTLANTNGYTQPMLKNERNTMIKQCMEIGAASRFPDPVK